MGSFTVYASYLPVSLAVASILAILFFLSYVLPRKYGKNKFKEGVDNLWDALKANEGYGELSKPVFVNFRELREHLKNIGRCEIEVLVNYLGNLGPGLIDIQNRKNKDEFPSALKLLDVIRELFFECHNNIWRGTSLENVNFKIRFGQGEKGRLLRLFVNKKQDIGGYPLSSTSYSFFVRELL